MNIDVVTLCDYIGTFAFAVSGIRLASSRSLDWFGAYVVGLVTAVGGGTLRDLMLGLPPFWLLQPSYMIITILSLIYVIAFKKIVIRMNPTIFIFDAIGLGLFVVVGIEKALVEGFPYWVAIVMGTVTGIFGGIIRDMFLQVTPLVFRKEIYALACVFGGIVYCLLDWAGLSESITQLLCAVSVFACRVICAQYHLSLPTLKDHSEYDDPLDPTNVRS